ncbi:MAG: hypothetical protein IJE08_13315, partial [Clostridia bacterium]|nr:hypothetical protein [Clostridia bacterium]
MIYNRIKHILPEFQFTGRYLNGEEIQSGNVNNTYHLVYRQNDGSLCHYTLQQINSYAFKDPHAVMHNIEMITGHLHDTMVGEGIDPN